MHPGRVLSEEFMEPMEIGAEQLAQRLGVPPSQLANVLEYRDSVTSDLALRLARCFRATTPQFWLGLQTAHDLELAQARFGAEIEKILPLAA
jgi:addiction module HigA family antidote